MGEQLLNGARLLPQAAPQMVIASPLNDIQLIGLMAAQLTRTATPRERVSHAIEILAEAAAQTPKLPALIRQKQKREAEAST